MSTGMNTNTIMSMDMSMSTGIITTTRRLSTNIRMKPTNTIMSTGMSITMNTAMITIIRTCTATWRT